MYPMLNGPIDYCGMPIIVNTEIGTWEEDERAYLKPKRWHIRSNTCYPDRIRKKWKKRWPPIFKPGMFMVQDKLLVHTSLWPKLRAEMAMKGVILR